MLAGSLGEMSVVLLPIFISLMLSLAHSHRLKASYDRGCCGFSSLVTSSTRCCLSVSSSSSNNSRVLSLISVESCCLLLLLLAARREKKPLHLAFAQPFLFIKQLIVLLASCRPHIVGHPLRVSFTPGLLAKIKSSCKVIFNLVGKPRGSCPWLG